MKMFLDTYLPAGERRSALWIVLGGAALSIAGQWLGGVVTHQLAESGESMAWWATLLIQHAVVMAFTALVVAALIRFGKAPKVLALSVVLLALMSLVFSLADAAWGLWSARGSIGSDYLAYAGWIQSGLTSVTYGLGAVAGAWIARTVSVDRIRNVGLTDDELAERGDRAPVPVPHGLAFMGWEGRPLRGDALVAWSLMLVSVLPRVVSEVGVAASSSQGSWAMAHPRAWISILDVLLMLVWGYSAYAVSLRLRVRSVWLMPLSGTLGLISVVVSQGVAVGMDQLVAALDATFWIHAALTVLMFVPAAAGVHLAFRSRPATLHASDTQDPDA